MTKISGIAFTVILCAVCEISMGQGMNVVKFENAICGNWKILSFDSAGIKLLPNIEQSAVRWNFYSNNTLKIQDVKSLNDGYWKFDTITKVISITEQNGNSKMSFKVLSYSNSDCIFEYSLGEEIDKIDLIDSTGKPGTIEYKAAGSDKTRMNLIKIAR